MMTEEERKAKLKSQQNEQYLAIGKFVVNFEHLFYAIKNKLRFLCGTAEEVTILLEPFSASQTIGHLSNVLDWKLKNLKEDDPEKLLFKMLISDLKAINSKRNLIVHTMWFIGWSSEKDTDISKFVGHKFSSKKNSKFKKLTAAEIDTGTERCKVLYRLMFTAWTFETYLESYKVPPLTDFYHRESNGHWIELKYNNNS